MTQSRIRQLLFPLGVLAMPLVGATASTQWLAARVGYHPRLGEPFASTPVPFYEPWQWFGWAAAAVSQDPALVLLTSLPLLIAVAGTALLVFYHQQRRPLAKASTGASNVPATNSAGVSQTATAANRTHALTLSDADVEVFSPSVPEPKTIDPDALEEVRPSSPTPTATPHEDGPSPHADKPSGRQPAHTVRADRASYGVLQRLAAQEHEEDEAPPESPKQLHVPPKDADAAHDAPTAEAPARSLDIVDTAEAPAQHPPARPLEVEPARADWAHEIATAEAHAPGENSPPQASDGSRASDTGRFSDVPTSAGDIPERAAEFPDGLDAELVDEVRRQLDALDLDDTAPEEAAAAVASLDLGSSTQKLGAVESAALAQFARDVARDASTAAPDQNDATSERPSPQSDEGEASNQTDSNNTELDEEEWFL